MLKLLSTLLLRRKENSARIRHWQQLPLALAAAMLLALPVQGASLSIDASGGSASIAQGGVYTNLNISGSASPTLEITKNLTLIGTSNTVPLISGANNAFMRVINSTLSLGSATNSQGGVLRGDVYLQGATLRVYSNSNPTLFKYYTIAAGTQTKGAIEGNGQIILRPSAFLNSGPIGNSSNPLGGIEIGQGARIQTRDGIWAQNITIDSGNISASSGDIHVGSLNLSGSAPSLQANDGDIFISNLSSSSPTNEIFAQSGIYAEGNVRISGEMNLIKGLTSIVAGKDILFDRGDSAVRGTGELYIKAGGNVSLESAKLENSHLNALRMTISGDLAAKNVMAAQLSSGTVNISENLEIQGNSVNIFGTKVDYGSLTITGSGNSVGGNLNVYDAKMQIPDLSVGKNVVFSAIQGTFDNLQIGGNMDFAAGELSGNELKAKSIQMGESEYASTVTVKNLSFNSLQIGSQGKVKTDALSSPNGALSLLNGGSFELTSGDMGSAAAPLGAIGIYNKSELNAPGSIYATSLTGTSPDGDNVSAQGDIHIYNQVSGTLNLTATGDIYAPSLSANSINAKNVYISAANLTLKDTSEIAENLIISAAQENARTNSVSAVGNSNFETLHVGGTMTVGASNVTGHSLTVGTLIAGNASQPSTVQIANISNGFGLGVGKNVLVNLGSLSSSWLQESVGSKSREATTAVLGLAKAVELGRAGLVVNPAEVRPAPTAGKIEFAPGSLLVVNGSEAKESVNPDGIISSNTHLDAQVQDGAKLAVSGITANNIYGVLGKNISTNYASSNAWKESEVESGSHLVGLRKMDGRNGWFSSYAKDPENVYPGLDPGLRPPLNEGNGGSSSSGGSSGGTSTPSQPGTSIPSSPSGGDSSTTPPSSGDNTGSGGSSGGSTPSSPSNPSQPGTSNPSTPSGGDSSNTPPASGDNTGSGDSSGGTNPGTPSQPTNPSTPSGGSGTTTPPSEDNTGSGTPSDTPSEPENPSGPSEGDSGSSGSNPPSDISPNPAPLPPPNEPALGTENKHFNSDYAGVRFLSRVTSTKYMDHNYDLTWKTIEAASRIAVLAAVPQLAYAANLGAVEASEGRATFSDRAQALSQELDGHHWALWITPLYSNLQGYGLRAYNLDYDFSAGLGGVVFGADYSFDSGLRFGLDASMGGGYSRSSGDMAKTTNDMGFVGIGAYAGWQWENFGLAADLHFTSTWNSIKQEFPSSLEMKDPTGELTARALSVGLRAEYRFNFEDWQLIPHVGVRYANVHTDEYSIYSGGAMIDGEAIEQNIWTYPLGVELRKSFQTESGWKFEPSIDFMLTPASGDIYATTKLRYTGVPGEANIDTQTMDYLRYGGRLGIVASKDNFNLGLDYKIQTGWRGTEQSVFGTFTYEF